MRSAPAVRELHETYKERGLLVIGVHSPEFDHERDAGNLRAAITQQGVTFPVLVDNDFAVWKADLYHFAPLLFR